MTTRNMRSHRLLHSVLHAFAAVLLLLAASAVSATTITVTTVDDELNVDGDCSLREAIRSANLDAGPVDACAAGSGADEIAFHPSVETGFFALTIPGPDEDARLTGDLDITEDLTIRGAGYQTTIDAGGIDRVFHIVANGATVDFEGIAIRSGVAPDGGGIFAGNNTVTLLNCLVQGNLPDTEKGGGIYSTGGLTAIDSVTSSNSPAVHRHIARDPEPGVEAGRLDGAVRRL